MWPKRSGVRIASATLLHFYNRSYEGQAPIIIKNLNITTEGEEALRSFLDLRSFSEVGSEEWAKMWFVYILRLKDNTLYTGMTNDLKRRIQDHNLGECLTTKSLKPVKLIWCSGFYSKDLAVKFERYLKTASGIAFRNKRLI